MEVMAVIRNIYGDDFMEIFEHSFQNIDKSFDEKMDNIKPTVN